MEFLGQPLSVTLANAAVHARHHSFFATMFDGRPTEATDDDLSWSQSIQQSFDKVVGRTSSPIEAASLLIDAQGACIVVDVRGVMQTGNAKSAVYKLLGGCTEEQVALASSDLHALDELDKERMEAMRTIFDCAPPEPKRRRTTEPSASSSWTEAPSLADRMAAYAAEVQSDEEQAPATSIVALESNVQSAQTERKDARVAIAWGRLVHKVFTQLEALTEVGDTSCSRTWASLRRQHNLLDEESLEAQESQLQICISDTEAAAERLRFWKESVGVTATVVVATKGVHSLTFERCYLEHRRELLLAKRLGKTPTLLQVVCTAVGMAEVGQLPPPGAGKQKSEFLKRCRKVLLTLRPTAIAIVKDLPIAEQIGIAMALGSEKRLCPCTKPAKIAFPQASWIWIGDGGVPELTQCFEAFCSIGCLKRHRPKCCPGCLKDDALAPKEMPCTNGYTTLYCTRCGLWGRTGVHSTDVAARHNMDQVRSNRLQLVCNVIADV